MKQKVLRLYRNIDERKWKRVLAVFNDGIQYERVENKKNCLIQGKKNLSNFYRMVRDLRGKHIVTEIGTHKNIVNVRGYFQGTRNGKPIRLSYRDDFVFDDSGLIMARRSVIKH